MMSMQKKINIRKIIIEMIFSLAIQGTLFGLDVAGERILKAIDEAKNFQGNDFSALMSMVKEDPEKGIDKMVVRQLRRDKEDKFVFLFLEPAVQKGQGYLRIDDNLWFYDPESRQFTHESMKERFGGTDARNSDFGKSSLTENYRVRTVTEGRLGKYHAYILDLEAKNNEVTYPKTKLWVTKDLYLVLKSEDYSATGRLLRTSFYPSYVKVESHYIPSRMIFIDELVKGKKTSLNLSEVSLTVVPDSVFTKTYLERVNH